LLSVLSLLFGLSSLVLEVAVSLPGKLPFLVAAMKNF
jgi:hypothetical protein